MWGSKVAAPSLAGRCVGMETWRLCVSVMAVVVKETSSFWEWDFFGGDDLAQMWKTEFTEWPAENKPK